MAPDQTNRLGPHLGVLRTHRDRLAKDAAGNRRSMPEVEFTLVAEDIRRCLRDFPDLLPPFDASSFSTGTLEGRSFFDVRALVAYLDSVVSLIDAQNQQRRVPQRTPRGFLSHAAEDRALADHLRLGLERGTPGLRYFMASLPGHITPGADFFNSVLRELQEADRYLVLLTPRSHERLWIAFEAGAACMFDERPRVLLCAGGLERKDVGAPLRHLQLLSLDDDGGSALKEMFQRLQSPLPDDLVAFFARAKELGQSPVVREGLDVGGRSYGWTPALDALEDRGAAYLDEDEVRTLDQALEERGLKFVWLRRNCSPRPVWTGVTSAPTLARDAGAATG